MNQQTKIMERDSCTAAQPGPLGMDMALLRSLLDAALEDLQLLKQQQARVARREATWIGNPM